MIGNMSNVLRVEFPAPPAPSPTSLLPLARAADSFLAAHAGATVPIRRVRDVLVVSADSVRRLSVTVGTLPRDRVRRPFESIEAFRRRRDASPRDVVLDVRADARWLVDPTIAKAGKFGQELAEAEFSSLGEACAWIGKECFRAPKDWVTAAEMASFWRRMVLVQGKLFRLIDAVSVFVNRDGVNVSVAELVEKDGLSPADAEAVVDAIRKIAPRRRGTMAQLAIERTT